jgi:NAD(P)-dependent dehydrogenase (short-subunit alcohol dehydrogenase family)
MTRRALITGANRGLGLGLATVLAARGWDVHLGARRLADAEAAAGPLRDQGHTVHPLQLDVTFDADIERLATRDLAIDVLVNNAGVAAAWNGLADASSDEVLTSFMTNALGPFRLIQRLAPGMARRGWGRVVNVSSGMGGLTEMGAGAPAYRISKTALNGVTKVCAQELAGTGVLVNAVCPGWVATRMGGENAPRSVADGVASILWGVDLPDDGPTGGFFRDGMALAW